MQLGHYLHVCAFTVFTVFSYAYLAGMDYFYHSNVVIFHGTHLKASTACFYFSLKGIVLIIM